MGQRAGAGPPAQGAGPPAQGAGPPVQGAGPPVQGAGPLALGAELRADLASTLKVIPDLNIQKIPVLIVYVNGIVYVCILYVYHITK